MAVFSRLSFVAAALLAVGVSAESHTVKFQNNCGRGTPQLINGGKVVSSGEDYTYNGVFMGIAYLQTGECLFNAEYCTMLEMTLVNPNPAEPGSGSSADISLIPTHQFNVPAAISYINGCESVKTECLTADCKTAFFHPDDTWVQVACEENNVGLLIEFCPNGVGATGGGGHSSSSVSKATPTSTTSATPSTTSTKSVATTSSSNVITTSAATPTSDSATPTTSVAIDTSSTIVDSTSTSADTSSSVPTSVVSTSVVPSSVVPSSVVSTTVSIPAAQSSSPVNRKQCKPGQKLVPKRDVAAKRQAAALKREAENAKREALTHHRRGHGHH